jgi:hypothetical protein
MFGRRYDVFFSYRRADTDRVLPLRNELRRRGYRVFFDTESIEGGDDWKNRLERSIAVSRALVLCWSENASRSEVVIFEYSCARALHRPVVPWLLDRTPLPVMLDHINGIDSQDVAQVVAALLPTLGWPIAARRRAQAAVSGFAAVALAFTLWLALKPPPPPPPWEFAGRVVDPATNLGIAGVTVEATEDQNAPPVVAITGPDGRYDLHLPPPRPDTLHLVFSKAGYEGDADNVRTNKPFNTTLNRLP